MVSYIDGFDSQRTCMQRAEEAELKRKGPGSGSWNQRRLQRENQAIVQYPNLPGETHRPCKLGLAETSANSNQQRLAGYAAEGPQTSLAAETPQNRTPTPAAQQGSVYTYFTIIPQGISGHFTSTVNTFMAQTGKLIAAQLSPRLLQDGAGPERPRAPVTHRPWRPPLPPSWSSPPLPAASRTLFPTLGSPSRPFLECAAVSPSRTCSGPWLAPARQAAPPHSHPPFCSHQMVTPVPPPRGSLGPEAPRSPSHQPSGTEKTTPAWPATGSTPAASGTRRRQLAGASGAAHLPTEVALRGMRNLKQPCGSLNFHFNGIFAVSPATEQKETHESKIVYSQSQKEILEAWFQHDPHPDKATKERLAKEIGVPESKITRWFKQRRAKQRQLESECCLEQDQTQEHSQPQHCCQEYTPNEDQAFITKTQRNKLVEAFKRNPFPDTVSRKKLARQTGLRESRIMAWFRKQRSLYPEQNPGEPLDLSITGPNWRPDLSVQQHQIDMCSLPDRSPHFPSSNALSSNQTFLLVHPPSHESSVPQDPLRVCLSQGPNVRIMQPTQAVQEGEDSDQSLTLRNHLPTLPTQGEDFSDIQTPFQSPYQECPNHEEHSGTSVQLEDYWQPPPEHKEQQSWYLGPENDISFIVQWWDEICQALIAEWDPHKGTH
ncbi:double homeobox protein B [Lemur catta]|uniref:double homeobox protein B n=1 Tax=Lemur catta TaxID=9447 RepID=UPI001E26B1CC|nr:double homeobox protein B [Lemur catta]